MRHLSGDLFTRFETNELVTFDAIAHVCNCQGVMGSGIAAAIKGKYPSAFSAYIKSYENWQAYSCGVPLLGSISYAEVDPKKFVFNMNAQDLYESGLRHLNYEALYKTLCVVKNLMLFNNLKTLGVPYNMGSDRAGGDWNVVVAMIDSVFDTSSGISVYSSKL